MPDVPTVLIGEASKFFASMISHRIRDELGFDVHWRPTYEEAVKAVECCTDDYLVALLDPNIPGSPDGEIIEYARSQGLPVIVIARDITPDARRLFLKWNVVDYVLKSSNSALDYLVDTIGRIQQNRDIKVLVVEDSRTARDSLIRLLSGQLFQVLQANDGREALAVLADHPDIKLIVTDYDMPVMDGFELIRRVREHHSKNKLAIIGMSASGEELLSARLLKTGANDFVPKPFQVEEFHRRVANAVEMIERIELIQDLSYRDSLTRLRNRRYFFENADIFLHSASLTGLAYSVGMIDIDHFKKVNDTYGHECGDRVLKAVGGVIEQMLPDDAIVARFGGEEFCVLLAHPPGEDVVGLFGMLGREIKDMSVSFGDQDVSVTVSIGVCSEPSSLETMLRLADSRLYAAKESGRNRVVGAPPSPNVRDR